MPEPGRVGRRAGWLTAVGVVLLAASLVYLGAAFAHSGREALRFHWVLSPWPIAASLALLAFDLLLAAVAWCETLRECGVELPPRRSLVLWTTTALGRYIPGRVWPLIGMIAWGRADGLDPATVWRSNVRLALYAAGGQLVAAAALLLPFASPLPRWAVAALVAGGIAGLALAHGGVWEWLDRRLGWGWTTRRGPSRRGRILLIVACQWLAFVLAVRLALHGVLPAGAGPAADAGALVPVASLPMAAIVAGGFAFAQTLSALAVVAPAGLAIREGALAAALGLWLPAPLALALAVGSRVWLTLGELVTLAVAGVLARGSAPREEPRGDEEWDTRATLPGLRAVLDPADVLGGRNRFIHELHAGALSPLFAAESGRRVLDVGCGTGRILGLWRQAGATAVGVDRSRRMMQAGPGSALARADVRALPFRDASFDAVSSVFVLHHVEGVGDGATAAAIARELRRVLRPGGRFIELEKTAPSGSGPIPEDAWASAGWAVESRRVVRRPRSWWSRLALVAGRHPGALRWLVERERRGASAADGRGCDVATVRRAVPGAPAPPGPR